MSPPSSYNLAQKKLASYISAFFLIITLVSSVDALEKISRFSIWLSDNWRTVIATIANLLHLEIETAHAISACIFLASFIFFGVNDKNIIYNCVMRITPNKKTFKVALKGVLYLYAIIFTFGIVGAISPEIPLWLRGFGTLPSEETIENASVAADRIGILPAIVSYLLYVILYLAFVGFKEFRHAYVERVFELTIVIGIFIGLNIIYPLVFFLKNTIN